MTTQTPAPKAAHTAPVKTATVSGLAVVGFVALILAGMFLAIYAAGYVPESLSRLASAVYLSPDKTPTTATTTPDTTKKPETPVVVPPTITTPTETPVKPTVSPNPPRVIQTQVPVPLYGLPDLAITSMTAGYMRGSTFVADDTVPTNRDAAVKFTVKNIGTNVASNWRIQVNVEHEDDAVGIGSMLRPQGYENFTLVVENPTEDNSLEIEVSVDYQDRLDESNERNNTRTVELDTKD